MKKKARKSGFGLVEVLMVVSIIGILALIVVPRLSRSRKFEMPKGENIIKMDFGDQTELIAKIKELHETFEHGGVPLLEEMTFSLIEGDDYTKFNEFMDFEYEGIVYRFVPIKLGDYNYGFDFGALGGTEYGITSQYGLIVHLEHNYMELYDNLEYKRFLSEGLYEFMLKQADVFFTRQLAHAKKILAEMRWDQLEGRILSPTL